MRALRALLAALVMLAAGSAAASAHTTLLSSKPAANAVIPATGVYAMRLLYSEPIEAALATITIHGPNGFTQKLVVRGDPRDVHAILADFQPPGAGPFRLEWHVVSADGHSVSGRYSFIAGTAMDSAAAPPPMDSMPMAGNMPGMSMAAHDSMMQNTATIIEMSRVEATLSWLAPIIRGAASFFILGAAGLLAFLVFLGRRGSHARSRRVATRFAITAFVFAVLHAQIWAMYATSGAGLAASWKVLMSVTAHAEIIRVVLTALTLWALLLARRNNWAAFTAVLAVLATAFIGHSAAMHSAVLIPLKTVHLIASALWLGGLLLLITPDDLSGESTHDPVREVLHVSRIAMWAVVLLTFTGIAQTWTVMSPRDLLHSAYGLLSIAKALTLVVLAAMGGFHRLRNIPAIQRGESLNMLRYTVTIEVAVIGITFLIAGFLAYTSPPGSQ